MTRHEFYASIDEILELAPGSLKGTESLKSLASWDSLAVMSFVAMLDGRLGVTVPASRIASCTTVGDLAELVSDKLDG
jgi:acyl carrier protein